MRGILGWGVHLPYRRLDRADIAKVAGTGGGRGTRSVASYDEDTTTMGAEAARSALRSAPPGLTEPGGLRGLWFSTAAPAYLDKTNAAAIHAAARLDRTVPAYDVAGSVRSSVAALAAALGSSASHLVVSSDVRTGRPGSGDEAAGGDGAAALLIGDGEDPAALSDAGGDDGTAALPTGNGSGTSGGCDATTPGAEPLPVLAALLGQASATEEFLDRWRTPGDPSSKSWEERFGETRYTTLGLEAWNNVLAASGLQASDVDHLVVCGTHDRAVAAAVKKIGLAPERVADRLSATVGNTGAAQPALLLASTLEKASPGQVIVLLVLADGADAFAWKTTDALAAYRPARPVADQLAATGPVAYGRFLAWRGFLPVEPPRRPEPARASASASARSADWKFGLVASIREDGTVHLPPSAFDSAPHPAADALGTIVTFTVDRLAYSPSPPVVFAVVDFDGGGRLPIELTDTDPDEPALRIGARVEATFRRLSTTDGIHNYFWKARLVRSSGAAEEEI